MTYDCEEAIEGDLEKTSIGYDGGEASYCGSDYEGGTELLFGYGSCKFSEFFEVKDHLVINCVGFWSHGIKMTFKQRNNLF